MRPSEVGERLRLVREMAKVGNREFSARELSRLAKLSLAMVAHIERGYVEAPGSAALVRLAGVLGVSVDWLAAGHGDAPDAAHVQASVDRAVLANPRPVRAVEEDEEDGNAESPVELKKNGTEA